MTVMLHAVEFVLSQDGDTNKDAQQELRVGMEESVGGPFLTLKTERWAMDHPDDLHAMLVQINQAMKPLFTYFERL